MDTILLLNITGYIEILSFASEMPFIIIVFPDPGSNPGLHVA
jgi:hypothetical protein